MDKKDYIILLLMLLFICFLVFTVSYISFNMEEDTSGSLNDNSGNGGFIESLFNLGGSDESSGGGSGSSSDKSNSVNTNSKSSDTDDDENSTLVISESDAIDIANKNILVEGCYAGKPELVDDYWYVPVLDQSGTKVDIIAVHVITGKTSRG
ncbi:hypothetical protein [Methanobrevibacter sp. DSM 116169]|uniref:hypothetical protein n=1 Tax=Methanobrevibacter sp. DSM 116169 TaxID=3242727 RepID=UPI0038FBF14C